MQQGQRLGSIVSATGTDDGAYCEYNRERGTADRLLVIIAKAATDTQHYTCTVLHKVFVSAVHFLGTVHRDDIQGVYKFFSTIACFSIEQNCFNLFM